MPSTANAAEAASELLSTVTDNDEPTIAPTATASELTAESVDQTMSVSLPVEGDNGGIAIEDQSVGEVVTIGLPEEATVGPATVATDGTVLHESVLEEDGVDIAAEIIEDGSVRIQTIILSPDAAHEFTYPLSLPDGTELTLTEDGAVTGTDSAGNFVAGIQTPWAKDINGADVETSFRIENDAVVQTVTPVDASLYPLVADPWFGKALISKAVWARGLWQYSPTLKVYPTWFGRNVILAPDIARWAAWNETLAKAPRTGWPNPNTASMRDQFYCHYDLARFRHPNKEYWGLDSKLPNRGYLGFVFNNCN